MKIVRQNSFFSKVLLFIKCFLTADRPLLFPAIFCAMTSYFALKSDIMLTATVVLISSVIAISIFFKFSVKNLVGYLFCVVLAFSVFSFKNDINISKQSSAQKLRGNFLITEMNETDKGFNGVLKVVKCSNHDIKRGTKISFYTSKPDFKTGDRILTEIEAESALNGEYEEFNLSEGILYSSKIDKIVAVSGKNRIYSVAEGTRNYINSLISDYTDKNVFSTIAGLLIGDKSGFSDEFSENIRHSGVSHVMVVSGMHLAIIMSAVNSFIKKMFYNRFIRFVCSASSVFYIMAVCGFTPSILRAGLMYIILSSSILYGRDGDSVNALSLSVCFILIFSPCTVFNISFQLSVLSTLGILLLNPVFERCLRLKNDFTGKTVSSILTSVSALIFTAPITVFKFKEFSLSALLTNLLISQAVTAVLVGMLITVFVSVIPLLSLTVSPMFKILSVFVKYINYIINTLGSMSDSYIECGKGFLILTASVWIASVLLLKTLKALKLIKRKESGEIIGGNSRVSVNKAS